MTKRGASEHYALSEDEMGIFWKACHDMEDKVLVGLQMFATLRVSEATHLKSNWVKENEIHVPSRMDCSCWECRDRGFWRPKSKAGARIIPISSTLLPHLLNYLHHHPDGLSFSRVAAWHRIQRVAKEAKVGKVFNHSLRATCATMLAKNLEAMPLAYLMGWANISLASHYVNIAHARSRAAQGMRETFG